MKTLIIITLITLSFFSNFCYASSGGGKKGNGGKNIEKTNDSKNETGEEKALKQKAKEEKIKNKIEEKLENKLSKFDNLSDEEKLIVYEKLIEKIDVILGKNNVSKTQKALYTLLKEIIIERKNSIKK